MSSLKKTCFTALLFLLIFNVFPLTSSKGQEYHWHFDPEIPPPSEGICRCHTSSDQCLGGNQISLRRGCGDGNNCWKRGDCK